MSRRKRARKVALPAVSEKSWFGGAEGSWRGPFLGFGELGGAYDIEPLGDGWQRNLRVPRGANVSALQAAISAYCNAFALMPVSQKRQLSGGGYETIQSSALTKWLQSPNAFQTPAEFFSSGIRRLLETGNAVAFARRNNRFEIVSTVWASHYTTYVDPETGAIFYNGHTNDGTNISEYLIPARDVMHIRLNAPLETPLCGRSPIAFCASSLCVNAQLMAFLNSFVANRASPSYVLTTDLQLNAVQISQLREAWDQQSQKMKSGGTPVLASGMKPVAMGVAPGDDLLVSTFNLTVEDIARAFNMPRALLGIAETAANAEQLLRSWTSLGLGSMVEIVEQCIERLFELPRNDHVEFDSSALLRLDAEGQMRVVGEGVTKGVLSPDEGRAWLGLAPVEGGYGKLPTVQQQQIPLDLLHALHVADIDSKTKAANPPAVIDSTEDPEPEPEPEADPDVTRALVSDMLHKRLGAAA